MSVINYSTLGPLQYSIQRIENLIRLNDIRIMELLESVQYGLGYVCMGFFAGVLNDFFYPRFDETKQTIWVFLEVLAQCITCIILVFYVRKIVKIMPFAFHISDKYHPYKSTEYSGELMISIVFIGSQFNIIKKIELLGRRLYNVTTGEQKEVGVSLGI